MAAYYSNELSKSIKRGLALKKAKEAEKAKQNNI